MHPTTPPAIDRLSNREADHRLLQAETARRQEIDRYWALCHADPAAAERATVGAAPIVRDIFCLARCAWLPPPPRLVDSLSDATARMLAVRSVRASLIEAAAGSTVDPVDAFWEDGTVVALKVIGAMQVLVVRYDGPLFNPATVPDACLTEHDVCRVVRRTENDGCGGTFETVDAYVIGAFDRENRWNDVQLDLVSRSDLMRDARAMEALVDGGHLDAAAFDSTPLPGFPTSSDRLITQLHAHKAALHAAGAISTAQQAVVAARTGALQRRIDRLRRHMKNMDDALYRLRCQVREEEARALEEETGYLRGDAVVHTSTNDAGVLEIVNFGNGAQFRLCHTDMYVTEDIRRGEWNKA